MTHALLYVPPDSFCRIVSVECGLASRSSVTRSPTQYAGGRRKRKGRRTNVQLVPLFPFTTMQAVVDTQAVIDTLTGDNTSFTQQDVSDLRGRVSIARS